MKKRELILTLLLGAARADYPVKSASAVGGDEAGNTIFSFGGNFADEEKLDFQFKCHGGHFTPCLIEEESSTNIVCRAKLDDGRHTLYLNNEECQLDACSFRIKSPEIDPIPRSFNGESRPRSRVESGRRNPDYREPPQKQSESSSKARGSGWNDTPGWPVVYDVLNGDVSINGGFTLTIEGENFGSKLDSFGEEGREGNSDIKVFLESRESGSWSPVAECIPIAHYHNPTQIFCEVFDRLPHYGQYRTAVFINGNAANWHCGCKKCDWMCKVGTYEWSADYIRQNVDSMRAVGQPRWTEWYSFEEFGSDLVYEWESEHSGQTPGQEFFWGDVWRKKNTTQICFAPLAMEARNDETGAILDSTYFDEFTREYAVCRADEGSNGCSMNSTSFRFFCDEGATKFHWNPANRDDVPSMDYDTETLEYLESVDFLINNNEVVGQCHLAYEDEENSEVYRFDPIEIGNHGYHNSFYFSCRVETDYVGHVTLGVKNHGRGYTSLSQESKFFDSDGEVRSFTLAPSIHSITPTSGYHEGGTRVTITGRGLAGPNVGAEKAEVTVGGVPCDIVSASPRTIVCDTRASVAIAEGAKHIGGAGADLEITTAFEWTMDTDQFRFGADGWDLREEHEWWEFGSEERTKFSRRLYKAHNSKDFYQEWDAPWWGKRYHERSDWFFGQMTGAFSPPITGYYTLYKFCDDVGSMWMNTDGGNHPDTQEHLFSNIRTFNPHSAGPHRGESASPRMFLEADKSYIFNDNFVEHSGRSYNKLSFIFHGPDSEINYQHDPVPAPKEYDSYVAQNDQLQVVQEVQEVDILSSSQEENIKVAIVSGDPDRVKFGLRWSNSNGQSKTTPLGTWNEHKENDGALTKTLISSQCETLGSFEPFYMPSNEDSSTQWRFPYGKTNVESFCGQKSYYAKWREFFAIGESEWLPAAEPVHIDLVPHFCFAHKGELDENSHNTRMFLEVGYMANGSSETFGEIIDNLSFLEMSLSPQEINMESRTSWVHMCIDLRALILANTDLTSNQNPDFVEHIYLRRLYFRNRWGYFDELGFGVASDNYEVFRSDVPIRPNTPVGNIDMKVNDNAMIARLKDTLCGIEIPDFEVVGGANTAVTVEDVIVFNNFNEETTGKLYTLTNQWGAELQIQVHEHQHVSPGVQGFFRLSYLGQTTPEIDIQAPDINDVLTSELKKLHGDVAMVNAESNGNCNDGYTLQLWWAVPGDFAPIEVQNINLTGVELHVETVDVRSGGIWIKEIPGAFLRTVHDEPQVVVTRNGISAVCNTDDQECSFSYLDAPADIASTSAAQVNTPASGEASFVVNFDAPVGTIAYMKIGDVFGEYCYADTQCRFVQTSETSVEIFFQSLPYGSHPITAYTEFGALLNSGDLSILVNPPAAGVSVSPSVGPAYGGNMVTISGKGVGIGEQVPFFDGVESKIISVSADEIVCLSPTIETTDAAVDIAFENGVVLGSFAYSGASYDLTSDRIDWSVKGNQEIAFSLSSAPADVESGDIFFDGEWIATLNFANNGFAYVNAPSDAKTDFEVKICLFKKVDGETIYLGWTSTILISYRLTIDSITPTHSSTAGGRILTINGRGFGTNSEEVQVHVGGIPCDVESTTWQEVTCKTRGRYETHQVILTGSSWFPQKLSVRANDRITWSWISNEEFTVQIGTTDSLNNEEKLSDDIVSNIVSGEAGTVETIVTAAPGTYFYTSGYMDGYSIFANGQIEVLPPLNYEEEVVLSLAGYKANTNPLMVRGWRKWTGSTDCATDGGSVSIASSETVAANCTACTTHTYSYDLTPKASSVEFDGQTLTIISDDFADQTDCPGAFNVVGRSAYGEIKFTVESVSATQVVASMPAPKANWPFGEDLQIEVSEFGRGNVLINSDQVEKFTVSPSIDSVSPRIGSNEGGALVTITGDGLKFDRYTYTKVSCCSEILTHTKTQIVCVSAPGKPGSSAVIGVTWHEKEPENENVFITLAGSLGGSYTLKTDFSFDFTQLAVEDDVNEFAHQTNTFSLDVSYQFPTSPDNLRAFMKGVSDGSQIELTNTYLELCEGKACFRSQWTATGYTSQKYDVWLESDNYGKITYGREYPSIFITSMQYNEGSHFGGHKIRMTTTTIYGDFPEHHNLRISRWGRNLCEREDERLEGYCTIEKISDNQIEIVTAPMIGEISGTGERADVRINFEYDNGDGDEEEMVYWWDSVSNRYHHDWTLTPGVSAVSSNRFSIGDVLSITLNGTEDGTCTGAEVYIGNAPCAISSCSAVGGTIDCIVGPQGDGDYSLTVFFPEVGYATINDGVDKVFTMNFDVTSISPSSGSYGGGVLVTLIGSGLGAETFDGRLCEEPLYDCEFPDFETAICRTPNIGVREHDSFVCTYQFYNADGSPHSSSRIASFGFTYQLSDTAIISDISPALGGSMGGTRITISGSGFVPLGQTVTIGQSTCDIISESSTVIVCETNSHPTSTKEAVIVELTSSGFAARDPNAPASFTGDFWYIDRWSSIFTWGCTESPCENKPVDYDIAVIPAGVTVLLDESTPLLSVLLIQGGTLLWNRSSGIKLRAQYVLITDEGRFELGTEEDPFCLDAAGNRMTADIELFGHSRSVKLPIYGAKVFAVRSGTLDLHGCPIGKSYSVLSQTANAGDSELVLKDVVETADGAASNWQAGDEVAIATTGGRLSMKQTERKVIQSVSGNVVTLTEPLEHRHIYHLSTWDGDELEVTAEVALLSRNVRLYGNRNMDWYEELPECTETQEAAESAVQTCFRNKWGDEVGSDEFGSHLIMHYIVRGRIRNIEVFHAGQGAQLGRYALHFHNSGNQPDSYISSNSIHDTFNRAITMHGVWNATIEWNVAFRCKGHNFFIEDAVEEDLLIQYNLAMMVKPAQSLLNTDQKATGFWITNTFNTIQHNRVAGSAQMGYWVNAPSVSGHANADCPPIVRSHCPKFTSVKKWYNNTGHDIGLYGFWVFTTEENVAYEPSTMDCQETWPPGEAIFEKGTFWNCKRGMELALVGDNVKVKDFTVANNQLGGLSVLETQSLRDGGMFDEYFTGIVDSKTIGYIDATVPELSLCTRFGVETPWKPDGQMTVDGIKFFNYDVSYEDDENVEPGWCSAIDACYSSYPFDCGRTSQWSNVQWFNSPRKFAADWEHETILVDMDGSLTGMGAPGYSVVPQSDLFPPSMCFDAPEFSVEFPAMICNSIEYNRYAVNKVLPDSLRGFSMIIENRWGQSFVPFRKSRSTSGFGYMGLLLSGEHHDISWVDHEHITNITYNGQLYDIGKDKMVTIRHPFYQSTDYAEITGGKRGVHANASDLGDIYEDFVGVPKEDGIFDRTGSPFDYYISPIDNSLTFGAMRGDYSNKFYDLNFKISVYKCFWPGCVPPTEPPPTTPPTISDYCNWSDPACWDDGVVPSDGANVTIANDKDVTLDIDITVDILFIEGTLRVSNETDVTINARVILINTGMGSSSATRNLIAVENGNFFVGSEESPICDTSVTINLLGNEFGAEFGAPNGAVPIGSKAIGNLGGLQLFGCPRALRSSQLAADLVAGDNQLTLVDDASSLQLGDELGIAPTSFDMREAEYVVVTGISGSVVTFDPPAQFDHLGNTEFAAEVVVLTRNVKISGASESSDFFGGRVVSMDVTESSTFRSGWAQVSDVEFVNMGQFGHTKPDDLRVPLAFYYIGLQDSSDSRRSFVTNSAFHHSYNGGIVTGAGCDGVQVEGNVFFDIVADAIEDLGENTQIIDNTVVFCQYRVLYQNNFEIAIPQNGDTEQSNLPAGISTIGTKTAVVLNNRVSGVEGYCYKSHGKACSSNDVCADSVSVESPPTIENTGHTCMFGAAIIKVQGRPCMEYSNFNFWKIMDYAFYTQAIGSDVLIKNNIVTDSVVGIQNVMIGNGDPLDHVHGNQKVSIDGNIFTAFSDSFACSDFGKRNNALVVTSGMTSMSRSRFNPRSGTTAIKTPYFQNKVNKWPKKPLDQQTGYTTLAGRSCVNSNTFINYRNQVCGNARSHIIFSTTRALTDHAPMVEVRDTTKVTSTKANLVYFHRPSVGKVSLDECVDMPCDGARRRFIKDIDGSLTNDAPTGQEVAIISQSEYHWEGVTGFPWSDNVDQRFGLGDYRIPTSMLTDIDGNVEDPYVYAPSRGAPRPDSCEYETSYNAYVCTGATRGFLNFESMDFDTEVRRIAPIGIRSDSGFLDLGNGPADHSCCAGYACSLRATMNYFLVNCGETYDFHTTGTMPTKVRFSLQQLPATCKIGIKMHTMRQNRQDVFLNGDNIIYSNQYDFANDTWRFPHPSMIPTLDEPSGSNYFDRAEQMLYFTLGGGDQLEVRIANSIILTLDITTELTIEEFYASSDLPYLLAAMLGLDPSQVKIVEVVRETNPARTWTHESTTVTGQLPENNEVTRVKIEFSNEFGSDEEDSVSNGGFSRAVFTTSSAINNKNVGNRLVAAQMEGRLEADISQASGSELNIVATTLTAQALSGETPAWYEKGTEGDSQTVLAQLGIDPDLTEGTALQDLIVETAELNNKTEIINSTNIEEQAILQETMDRTTKAVSYDQVPTTMVVVQQIPQKVFVGSRMRYPIRVAMLDANHESMTEVGYMGDPMRITISSSPDTLLKNTETYFVPGNGIANFDYLEFAEAGRFSFSIALTYTGEADIAVADVQTISFDVTADVPSDLAFDMPPPETVVQRRPFSAMVIMYDSAGNLMTGDILTPTDPWRVCAAPVNGTATQELLGEIEVPFVNGVAKFDNLQFKEIQKNAAVRFYVCYAAGEDVEALGISQIISESISVTNIDECLSALHNCDPNASCTDTEGSYTCECNDGFTGNGFVCIEFVDECTDETHECSEYATCVDAPVGYTCACNTGFSGDGYTCEDDDECMDETDWCDDAISICVNELGTFSCQCNSGYESINSKQCRDIDECVNNPCDGENQECTNTPGSYECACGEGFKLNWRDECVDINECNTGDHVCGENTQCENQLGTYTCVGTGGGGACTKTCDPGFECGFDATGGEICVDVDECADAELNNCQSFETCVNTNGKFRCDFDRDTHCPAEQPWKPEWKGRKNMRYIYLSDEDAMLAMKFRAKNRLVNPRTDLYYGFVVFTKDVCGVDFLRAINDGRVQIGFVDSEPVYEHKITYFRNDKKFTNAGFSFRLTQTVDKDTPWTRKQGQIVKNMGSDDVQIIFMGLDKINWLTNAENCLLTAANAILPDGDYPDVMTPCVLWEKIFWNTPTITN